MSRPCTICSHPRRVEIDAHAEGLSETASKFAVSKQALNRHRKHLTPAPKRAAGQVEASGDARSIAIETLTALRARLADCPAAEVPKVANSITAASRLLAKVSGQLELTQTQIVRSTPFRELMARLDEVLERHPAAAEDWAMALAGMSE